MIFLINFWLLLQALREILEQVRTFSKLEALLLKKKSLRNGDSLQLHSEKVKTAHNSEPIELGFHYYYCMDVTIVRPHVPNFAFKC